MDNDKRLELTSLLEILPPVEFCCIYGSSLHPNNLDKTSMIDYILGVADPRQWHAENLKMNPSHYASWMVRLGGARLITDVADDIGVGVHFNPFITHNDWSFKYGVVRMHDLVQDVLGWERFYLSGRLQKPVNIILDYLGIAELNSVNLKAATSAALLLLPSKFCEDELYAKICGLSYMGDIRMLFAEDKNKVKKIVQGQFNLFQTMYKPILEEYAAQDLLRYSSSAKINIMQDCELSTVSSLVSSLPWQLRGLMGSKLGEKKKIIDGAGFGLKDSIKPDSGKWSSWIMRGRTNIRGCMKCFRSSGADTGDQFEGRGCRMRSQDFESESSSFQCETGCCWSVDWWCGSWCKIPRKKNAEGLQILDVVSLNLLLHKLKYNESSGRLRWSYRGYQILF